MARNSLRLWMFSLQCVQILTKIGPYYSEEIFVLTETNVV